MKHDFRLLLHSVVAMVAAALWLLPGHAAAGAVQFVAQSQVSAQAQRLFGQITLTLQGEEIKQAQVFVHTPSGPLSTLSAPTWKPEQKQTFSFDFPAAHPLPGWYHLLLEIRFQDQGGVWFSSAMGTEYRFGNPNRSSAKPLVTMRDNRLEWPTPALKEATLLLTSGPHWRLERTPLTPADNRLELLLRSPDESPLVGWNYNQIARLDWVEEGVHQSRIFPWVLRTDPTGKQWQGENQTETGAAERPAAAAAEFAGLLTPSTLFFLILLLLGIYLNRGILLDFFRRKRDG
ncbi:MAG: hypothetical protein H7835_05120 [Magnetococcus sp. XQGC-1]